MAWKKSPAALVATFDRLVSRLLGDDAQASPWIERAHRHVATMPAKRKKAPKPAARRRG